MCCNASIFAPKWSTEGPWYGPCWKGRGCSVIGPVPLSVDGLNGRRAVRGPRIPGCCSDAEHFVPLPERVERLQ